MTKAEESEIIQAILQCMEAQAYVIDLLHDPEEVGRWQYVLSKTPHIKKVKHSTMDVIDPNNPPYDMSDDEIWPELHAEQI